MAERTGKLNEVEINVHSTPYQNGYSRLLIGTESVFVASMGELTGPLGNMLGLLRRVVRYDTFEEVTGNGTFTVLKYIVVD